MSSEGRMREKINGKSKGRKHGKSIDRSSPWSEYIWDQRGFYYSCRYGPDGQVEYKYPPEVEKSSPPLVSRAQSGAALFRVLKY